jgi:hypothetical protein
MELKVRKMGNGFGVRLPKQLLEEMFLEEGALIEVAKVEGVYQMKPADAQCLAPPCLVVIATPPVYRRQQALGVRRIDHIARN